ncbi:MAG: hypothetical protein JXR05_02830 [Flavobacteriaceae bacterium]
MKNVLKVFSVVVLTLILTAFTAETNIKDYDPVGVWDYEVETPDGTVTGEMTISRDEEKKLEVSIESEAYGTLELEDVKLEKSTLEGNTEIEGQSLSIEMEFDGDSMEGTVYMGEQEMSLSAERKKE